LNHSAHAHVLLVFLLSLAETCAPDMINLLSDESDDEEQAGTPVYSSCCRGGLYVGQTKLTDPSGQRFSFRGLYSATTLPPGAFVGFYTGQFFTPESYSARSDSRRRNKFAISINGDIRSEEIVVSPPVIRGTVDATHYPLALANEPAPQDKANCVLCQYKFTMDELTHPSLVPDEMHGEELVGVGLVTMRRVGAHRELAWYYGPHFHRTYTVGKACSLPKGLRPEDPLTVLGQIPNEGVCVTL
jgi:hypothetical protein